MKIIILYIWRLVSLLRSPLFFSNACSFIMSHTFCLYEGTILLRYVEGNSNTLLMHCTEGGQPPHLSNSFPIELQILMTLCHLLANKGVLSIFCNLKLLKIHFLFIQFLIYTIIWFFIVNNFYMHTFLITMYWNVKYRICKILGLLN